MEKQYVDVIIATPGHSLTMPYVKSFLPTIEMLANKGISMAFVSEYSSHVANAREATINGGTQNNINESRPLNGQLDYKKIIWIDSDIAWKPDDFLKLYESDKDIISGAYLLGSGMVTAYKEQFGNPYLYDDVIKMTEPVQIEGAGFGFLAVKKGVFESLTRPWFQQVQTTMIDPETKKEFSFPLMGEDISWCKRVKDAGYEIWFDPTIRVTHHKTMKLTWEGIQP